MKKSTKITLIVAVILMLVGGIVALVCMVLGADLDDIGLQLPFQNVPYPDISSDMTGEDVETWNFAGKEIHSLNLDMEACTLYIENGDAYMVAVKHGREGLRCEVKNGVLKVKETDSIHTLLDWSGKRTPIIRVVIPEGAVVETINVTVGAGDVQAQSLQTKSLDMDVDAGNISCQQLQVQGRCQIDVDAGSVSIDNGQVQGGLKVDVDTGMVRYAGTLEGDWQVDVDAGSVEMALVGSLEDYDYQIEYDMGSVSLGDWEYSNLSDEVYLDHDAQYRAQIQCDMGQVEVSFTW